MPAPPVEARTITPICEPIDTLFEALVRNRRPNQLIALDVQGMAKGSYRRDATRGVLGTPSLVFATYGVTRNRFSLSEPKTGDWRRRSQHVAAHFTEIWHTFRDAAADSRPYDFWCHGVKASGCEHGCPFENERGKEAVL